MMTTTWSVGIDKMNMKLVIGIIIAIIVLVVLYFVFSDLSVSALHTVKVDDMLLYSGAPKSIVSSDRVDRVLFTNSNGVNEYNTTTKVKRLLNSVKASGLAYDGTDFMVLQTNGNLSRLNTDGSLSVLSLGYQALYDTSDGGYFMQADNVKSATGPTGTFMPAKGDYDLIKIDIR